MNPDGGFIFTMGFLVGAVIITLSALIFFYSFKTDAVKAGAIEWTVSDDGSTEFKWIDFNKNGGAE